MSDVQGALCHLTLQYLDWLALQLMPDTAETEWLDRHGDIWLNNSDGTTGRKMATLAHGVVTFTGILGVVVPLGSRLRGTRNIDYELLEDVTLSSAASPGSVRALDPGTIGNRDRGDEFTVLDPPYGCDGVATVVAISGGVDDENDDDLRTRVLERIRQPPMGGCQTDYVMWAKAIPGVTRAWCGPLEMGIGTVTVRFMMDELRAEQAGFPTAFDVQTVRIYLDTVRPVAVKDIFVVAPLPQRIDVHVVDLSPDTATMRAGIEAGLQEMLMHYASPGQTIFTAWKYYAIMSVPGVDSFDLLHAVDDVMQSPGHMPVLGDIIYGVSPPA